MAIIDENYAAMSNTTSAIEMTLVDPSTVPMALLLEADPSTESINSYLSQSWCFVARSEQQIVAVCVVKQMDAHVAELFNVAVLPEYQQQGIGSALLAFVLRQLPMKAIKRVELGTGTFGYQLTYYQRLGFRVEGVIKDHFVHNYAEPIFEQGIQHQDMLRLAIDLENNKNVS